MSELFKNIVKLPPPHTARSYSELTPVYTADEVAKTVSSFEVELAKANERVKELEIEKQLLISEIEPLLDMQDGGEYYTRNSLADDIYEKFIGGSSAEALNKFALEQKIEVLREYRRRIKGWGVETRNVDVMIEQLRKGGES